MCCGSNTTFCACLFLLLFLGMWASLMYDSQTGLTDSRTELETALNNNPGIFHLFYHWKHHYRATAAGTVLPYDCMHTN